MYGGNNSEMSPIVAFLKYPSERRLQKNLRILSLL